MTLYELETVKVPITDTNLAANSYTEVKTFKPYIAFYNDYYIQLCILELHMHKQIWHSYYCEELFWLNINLNMVVKVPFTITYPKKSLMNTALSSIFITLQ